MIRISRFDIFCIILLFIFFLHTVMTREDCSLQDKLSGYINATKHIRITCEVKINATRTVLY